MSLNEVSVIDYGLGNLRSVENALNAIGVSHGYARRPDEVKSAKRLILPGVGSFRAGMENLTKSGLADSILAAGGSGTPILGICLGMQLLVSRGEEGGVSNGLGLIPGTVKRFDLTEGFQVPHMGFNEVNIASPCPLFEGISDGSHFYFVHSYHVVVQDQSDVLAVSEHGYLFSSVIRHANVFGTQFHPEKSQSQGLQLLKNFCAL